MSVTTVEELEKFIRGCINVAAESATGKCSRDTADIPKSVISATLINAHFRGQMTPTLFQEITKKGTES